MKPVGHLAGGYLAARAALKQINPTAPMEKLLLAVGTMAGLLPDMDALFHVARTRSFEFGDDYDHHRWITHTFPFYLGPGLLVYIWGHLSNWRWLKQLALITTVGAVTHLLQDAIGSGTGLMWAWPFSKRMDGICTLHVPGGKAWLAVYNKHPIAWVERLIIVAALAAFMVDLLGRRSGKSQT